MTQTNKRAAARVQKQRRVEAVGEDGPKRLVPLPPTTRGAATPEAWLCDGAFSAGLAVEASTRHMTTTNPTALFDAVQAIAQKVKAGDLSDIEEMLVGQAVAMQALFASLAQRAAAQDTLQQYETFLGLAFRAQAQSRATIQALCELKYPRSVAFVKQANIANGPQQVNNGAGIDAREEAPIQQSRLLESGNGQRSSRMDPGASTPAEGADPVVAAMGTIDGPANGRGQGARRAQRGQGR